MFFRQWKMRLDGNLKAENNEEHQIGKLMDKYGTFI
jgi:hypothetical protein